jgi:hypothetical protein
MLKQTTRCALTLRLKETSSSNGGHLVSIRFVPGLNAGQIFTTVTEVCPVFSHFLQPTAYFLEIRDDLSPNPS